MFLILLPNAPVITSIVRALTSVPGGPGPSGPPLRARLPPLQPLSWLSLAAPFWGRLRSHSGVPGPPPFPSRWRVLGECCLARSGSSPAGHHSLREERLCTGQQRPGRVALRADFCNVSGNWLSPHGTGFTSSSLRIPHRRSGQGSGVEGSAPDPLVLGGQGRPLSHWVPSPLACFLGAKGATHPSWCPSPLLCCPGWARPEWGDILGKRKLEGCPGHALVGGPALPLH